MNVHETTKIALEDYPRLFPNGGEFIYFVLAVIGNGYYWRNGEAVCDDGRNPWSVERDNLKLYDPWRDIENVLPDYLRAEHEESRNEDIAQLNAIVSNSSVLADDWEVDTTQEGFPYPQSSYALIMNVPKNVTPDWAEAVAHVRKVLEQHGWEF